MPTSSRRTLLGAVGIVLLLTGCPPQHTQPPVTAIALTWSGTDSRHGDTSSTMVVKRDGCYVRKHNDPRIGSGELHACLPKQQVDKWIAQLDAIKNKRGQTKATTTAKAKANRQLHVSRTPAKRSFSLAGNDADARLRTLADRLERVTTAHWDDTKPRIGTKHPLGFSMVSLASRSKHGTYRATIDTSGRWRCSIDGYPFPVSGRFTFSADTYEFAGRVTGNTARTMLTTLFAGIDTTTDTSSTTKIGTFAVLDSKRALSSTGAATLLSRWRILSTKLSAECAMKNR